MVTERERERELANLAKHGVELVTRDSPTPHVGRTLVRTSRPRTGSDLRRGSCRRAGRSARAIRVVTTRRERRRRASRGSHAVDELDTCFARSRARGSRSRSVTSLLAHELADRDRAIVVAHVDAVDVAPGAGRSVQRALAQASSRAACRCSRTPRRRPTVPMIATRLPKYAAWLRLSRPPGPNRSPPGRSARSFRTLARLVGCLV